VLLFLLQNRTIKVLTLHRILLYFTVVAGFTGVAFLKIAVGSFHLFPYRILLSFIWLLFIIGILYNQGRVDVSHIKVKSYLQFLVLWLSYAVLSLAWASAKNEAVKDIIFLFMAFSIIFFVVYYFINLKDLKQFYTLWLLILLPMLGLGFWNHITRNHLTVSALVDEPEALRFVPTAVFHNQNEFATYLALSIPFVLTFIRYNSKLTKRLLGLLMLVASLYLIAVTFSRANYLAVITGAAFWFFFLLRFKGKMRALAVTGLTVVLLFYAFPDQIQGTFRNINEQVNTLVVAIPQVGEGGLAPRFNAIRNGFVFFVNSFGFGIGPGNAEYHMAHFPVYYTYGVLNMHNWWIEILVNYGLLIFLGYVVFYLSLIAGLYRSYKKLNDTSEKMICEALLVGLVAFFFASMSSSSIMALSLQWIFFAFALSFLNYCRIRQVRRSR